MLYRLTYHRANQTRYVTFDASDFFDVDEFKLIWQEMCHVIVSKVEQVGWSRFRGRL